MKEGGLAGPGNWFVLPSADSTGSRAWDAMDPEAKAPNVPRPPTAQTRGPTRGTPSPDCCRSSLNLIPSPTRPAPDRRQRPRAKRQPAHHPARRLSHESSESRLVHQPHAARAARREPAADGARRAAAGARSERPHRRDRRGQDPAGARARPAARRPGPPRDRPGGAAKAYVERVCSSAEGIADGDDRIPDGTEEIVLARRVWPDGRTRAYVCGRSATQPRSARAGQSDGGLLTVSTNIAS